jgi:hypothetical protein
MIKRLDFSNIEYQLSRAKEHLADIEAEISDIVESNHDIRTEYGEGWDGQWPSVMSGEIEFIEEAPRSIRGKIGEFAINLRSALNFMTVLLAKFDSGIETVGDFVQFPIDDIPDLFRRHRKNYLAGIRDEHIAFFERHQPYNRCDRMKRLREVSNTSKHVDLVLVKAEYSRLRGTAWDGEYDETQGGFIEGREVNVEEVTADISFPGRTPVIDELQLMQAQVAQIFEEFKTLFVRAGQRNRS